MTTHTLRFRRAHYKLAPNTGGRLYAAAHTDQAGASDGRRVPLQFDATLEVRLANVAELRRASQAEFTLDGATAMILCTTTAMAAPANSAATKAGALDGAMPVKLSLNIRPKTAAGFAKDVDAVNQ